MKDENIKKELKHYDNLINSFKNIKIGDMTPIISYLTKKRSIVAMKIGKNK